MERLWYIKTCRLFDQLTPDQLAQLDRRARMRHFARNTPVYLPSDSADGVLLLAEGRVKLGSLTPDGKQAILAFIEPGEIFGELALLGDGEREEYAETVSASTILLLPRQAIQDLLEQSPELSLGITKLIGWRRRRIERRLKTLLFRTNRQRLIHVLLDLAEQYGQATGEDIELTLRLSHQDLASLIGATRETVTVLLGELQLEGLVKVGRQRLVMRDLARLAEYVGDRPRPLPPRPSVPDPPPAELRAVRPRAEGRAL